VGTPAEKVTFSAGVPTVWLGLINFAQGQKLKFSTLKRTVIGGSACPPAMMRTLEDEFGIEVIHAWGMTEMSPLGTLGTPDAAMAAMSFDEKIPYLLKQGRPPMGVELKLLDDNDNELPHDGKTFGRLMVKGHAVVREYFKGAGGQILDKDGFFDTGDVATIDPAGFMQITDRAKDVIKSGGEWISSIDIENIAVGHPKAELAAVIGVPHPKWDERPLLLVKLKPGETATREEFLQFLEGKIAKWWMPDDVIFVDDIPLGATGKIDKKILRQRYGDHVLPTIAAAAAATTTATLAERAAPDPVLRAPEPVAEPAPEPPATAAPTPEPEPPVMTPPPADAPAMFVAVPSPKDPPKAEPAVAPPEAASVPQPAHDPIEEPIQDPIADPLAEPPAVEPEIKAKPVVKPEAKTEAEAKPEPVSTGPTVIAQPLPPASDKPPAGPLIWSVSDKVDPKDVPPALPSMPDLTPVAAGAAAAAAPLALGGLGGKNDKPAKVEKGAKPAEPVRAAAAADAPLSMPITPRRAAKPKGGVASGYLTLCILLALVPGLLVLGGALGVRFGVLTLEEGKTAILTAGPSATVGWAQAAALVALLASIIGLFVAVFAGWSRLWRKAALALALCLATWAGFIGLKQLEKGSPPLHDVATEWSQALTFSPRLMAMRGAAANPVDLDPILPMGSQAFAGRRVADVNAETCASARPVTLTSSPAQAFQAAKASLLQSGLELVTEDAAAGRLEAVATGILYGQKSDVVVQVSPSGQGSVINLRSISRQGEDDMGANCRRIGRLIQGLAG
jgi:fatty-acyl-CoA synthase